MVPYLFVTAAMTLALAYLAFGAVRAVLHSRGLPERDYWGLYTVMLMFVALSMAAFSYLWAQARFEGSSMSGFEELGLIVTVSCCLAAMVIGFITARRPD